MDKEDIDRELFMKCVNMIAHGIYGAEAQAKYCYNQMIDEPDDEDEWSWRLDEAIDEAQSYRDKYGYFKELEDAIELLRASELYTSNHPYYSYDEQINILKKAVEKGYKFDFLLRDYYAPEDRGEIVTALATIDFISDKQFQDYISYFEPY